MQQRRKQRHVSGILLLDKPAGLTSNQALQRVKRLYQAAKAGHTGSLDPLATGMLPICLGSATKVSQFLLDASKTYRVVSRLGVATDSGDADGAVTEERPAPVPDAQTLAAALARFRGEIEQVPPMYSALKQDGQRLYRLARRGLEVEREPRRVTIHSLELDAYDWPELAFTVTCSKGTYVRALVVDIAAAAGTVGHVTALRRLAVAPFAASEMRTLDALEARLDAGGFEAIDEWLLPTDNALAAWPGLTLQAEQAERLKHGQSVAAEPAWPTGRVRMYGPRGAFVGVGEVLAEGRLVGRRIF
jgi:tRNA pseudouridine55 synthase